MTNDMQNYYVIDINMGDDIPVSSMIDEIQSLQTHTRSHKDNYNNTKDEDLELNDDSIIFSKPKKEKNKKKKEKKKGKRSILEEATEFDIADSEDEEEDDEILLDIEDIIREREDTDIDDDIINEQKNGYKKLKKEDNTYKKEFAEELTLLYNLLDETGKFGKDLEKEFKSLKSSRARGVSKYTNDLAELVLSSKQNKLNILKEISSVKKTIADLKIKAEGKEKNKGDDNSPERLASAYFKNVLSGGRSAFINNLTGPDEDNEYDDMIERIETMKDTGSYIDDGDNTDMYDKRLEERLAEGNPFRSEAGTKYIEYENSGVKIHVKKCIDTGEWEFIALDKHNQQIFDYPLPSKRSAGRMRFSEDGSYVTDEKGIMYNVIEYYLPDEE